MSVTEFILLIVAGTFAGAINTLAGGGSLITMPLLIFMGLPSAVANASNRIAIFTQNIFAVQGFRSKGLPVTKLSYLLIFSATLGAIAGTYIAIGTPDHIFNRILAVVMILVVISTLLRSVIFKNKSEENTSKARNIISVILFFGIGIYGGFIQAGIGFLVIAVLSNVHGFKLAKTNSIKVFTALGYSGVSLLLFALEGKVNWQYGLVLAIGNSIGGWLASRWSVGKDDRLLQWILAVTVAVLAGKLWFF